MQLPTSCVYITWRRAPSYARKTDCRSSVVHCLHSDREPQQQQGHHAQEGCHVQLRFCPFCLHGFGDGVHPKARFDPPSVCFLGRRIHPQRAHLDPQQSLQRSSTRKTHILLGCNRLCRDGVRSLQGFGSGSAFGLLAILGKRWIESRDAVASQRMLIPQVGYRDADSWSVWATFRAMRF